MDSTDETLLPEELSAAAVTDDTIVAHDTVEPVGDGAALQRGASVGRYVVVERLGAGGMGVVYTAYDPELDRKVALKLLAARGGAETDATAGRSRLVREAQAMAQLSDPNVVAVHDVGTVGDRVFVAMEFIEGQTLARWLAGQRSWREILRVYVEAGRGLAAAHAKGLVHRDFKPDNVMIDGAGRVRVLDFGLARPVVQGTERSRAELEALATRAGALASSSSSLDARLTATGALMGTPAYMAPEQHLGKPADARTDQFSFCVALHEALYGFRPFAGDNLAMLAFEVVHGDLRDPPRGTAVPAWVRRALIRGLQRDPDRRFASMSDLLSALEADPARMRHRALTLLGAVMLGSLAAWGYGTAVGDQARQCLGSEARLTGVWDEERRASLREAFTATNKVYADDTWRRVERAFDDYAAAWSRMERENCEATRVRGEQSEELMHLRAACLADRLRGARALTEVFAGADASVLPRAVSAISELPDVAGCAHLDALQAGVPPPDDPQTRERVDNIRGHLADAEALLLSGRYREGVDLAAPLAREAEALSYRPIEAEVRRVLGQLQQEAGAPREAVESLRRAVWLSEASGHDRITARAWLDLVTVEAYGLSRYDDAERSAVRADAAIERIGNDRELRAQFLARHGMLLKMRGQHGAAEAELRLAVRSMGDIYGPDHYRVADVRNNLGTTLLRQRRYEEAEVELREAQRIWAAQLGEHHPKLGRSMVNLEQTLKSLGRHAEALESLERALAIFEAAHGPDHPHVGAALNGIGLLHEGRRRHAQAVAAYERALELYERTSGPRHLHVSHVLNNLGNAMRGMGEYQQSLDYHQRALELKREVHGEDSKDLGYSFDNIAETHLARGDHDAALEWFGRSVRHFERVDGKASSNLAYPLTGIGKVHLERGRARQALDPLERAARIRDESGADPEDAAPTWFTLARALLQTGGDRGRAIELARRALTGYERAGEDAAPDRERVVAWLARVGR